MHETKKGGLMSASSPSLGQKKILKHQNSVKSEKGLKRVSLEVVDEKPSRMSRQSSMMKNDKLYCMGTSFDERSDDESYEEFSVPVPRNSSNKNLVESIPLMK
ncbi:hypothetical protein PVAND_004374 [Polypedilum vanderplanki]|uniref:Uncharacterized protein n=1 Tax=Polypedilum vanderplanki TaxID=319348 RepID=A0A9J6BXJ0_POLVA|nr:hypothetical protein PVAND_004374 [Polypedilum vanderplanki]